MEKFIVKFDYQTSQLQEIVKDIIDNLNVEDLEDVKESHKKLVKIRTTIKKQEKEFVDEANKYRKEVFDRREELLNITEPAEQKLKDIIDAEEKKKIIEARKALLPMKKQQLTMLDVLIPSDEELLEMDEEQWVDFYNEKVEEHKRIVAQREREDQIREEMKVKAEKEKEELLKRAEEDKNRAVEDERRKAVEKELNDKKIAEEKQRKEKEDHDKLERNKKYAKFLSDNKYNAETDKVFNDNGEVKLYRLVATLKLK